MAENLDASQRAALSAFVNSIAQAAGYTTTAEWSRDSGYPAPNLSKLRGGKGAVSGYNLLRLIRAAAERGNLSAEQLAVAAARGTDAVDPSIRDRLEDLAVAAAEALEILRDLRARGGGQNRGKAS